MKTYKIQYNFEGTGSCIVKAESEEKARELFYEGEYKDDNECGENYNIDFVKDIESEIKKYNE